MSITLLVYLVFLGKIVAYDSIDSYFGSTSKYTDNYPANIIKFDTENSNDSPDTQESYFGRENYIRRIISGQQEPANSIAEELTEETNKNPNTDKEGLNGVNSAVISYPPYTQYEVTEVVSDIPDSRTPAGPIVTNYTHRPPLLNIAKPNNKTEADKLAEANIKTKKNRVSILHINAEFDDKVNQSSGNKVGGIFKGIKEYIHNFHRGIVNGIHSFFHKHDNVHGHGEKIEKAVDNVKHDESDDVEDFEVHK